MGNNKFLVVGLCGSLWCSGGLARMNREGGRGASQSAELAYTRIMGRAPKETVHRTCVRTYVHPSPT